MVEVVDLSGTVESARPAAEYPPEGDVQVHLPDGPVQLGFARLPTEPNSLVVEWLADPCNTRDRLTVSADASAIRLSSSPPVACHYRHTRGHRVVLAFDGDVDISAIRAAAGQPFIDSADIRPNALGLTSTSEIWVGGWTSLGESFLLHSTSAGDAWKLVGLGWGHVLDVAPLDDGGSLAAVNCSGINWLCEDGLVGSDTPGGRIGYDPVWRVSMRSSADGVSVLGPHPGGGDCCYWLRPTTTSGLGLPEIANP
jgi:hypothetical protein